MRESDRSANVAPARVPFGRTDMKTTRVGVGAWAIGGLGATFAWGPQDDDASIAAIHRAVELGVNWIDTAPIYGLGHSEEVVGAAVAALPEPDRPYIFTKCGLRWGADAVAQRVGAEASLRFEVEQSLRRLGVERIDLYQMHWPAEDGSRVEDYWPVLLDLVREGKVRAVGLSNHGVAQLEAAEGLGHVDSLQPPFSAIRRDAAAEIIPWCHEHGTAVINYSPLQAGLLSGAFTSERAAALTTRDDWRGRSPDFTGDALTRNLGLAAALAPVAERHDVSVAAVAVAWTLAFPGVTGAIVGARSPGQVDGWIAAANLELTEADLDEIAAAISDTGAGEGPAHPRRTP
jgi:aryl-alcohol dehydrogenase-like predicted oxidoreductase